ncbi:hypothetical protein PG310_10110 [Riemerella anatipestifer]|uniref:hypothetical protein n=1 Tax=Riemerella anatipestifer TaxID=34085 RepID=UPI002A89C522|nr:hypothetical protein [Riemerella anatipestifer]MDY3526038.1 hypothetical protein [Riemerella anatipestifer]
MEKMIIILLFIIIFFLLWERNFLKPKSKNSTPKSSNPLKSKEKEPYTVIGKSKFVAPKVDESVRETKEALPSNQKPIKAQPELKKTSIPAQIPDEDLEAIFSKELNEDEEEDLRAMRTPEEDDDFAMGLSFEELAQVEPLFTKKELDKEEEQQATSIAKKLSDTELLNEIEKVLPQARQRVSELLDRDLKSPPTKGKEDFDIGDFV